MCAEPPGEELVGVLDLSIEFEQFGGHPLDQLDDRRRPLLVLMETRCDTVDSGRADLTRSARSGDQDQRGPVGIVERVLEARKDRAEQTPQPVDHSYLIGHQIGAVRG